MLPPLKVGLASVAGIVAAGGLLVGATFAQTPNAPNDTASWLTRFAQTLGKSEADVKAAALQATNQQIDQAVQAGRLTAQQAQQLKDRAAQAPFAGPGGMHQRGPGGPGGMRGGMADMNGLAQFLGVQPADLRTALSSGKTLAQFAQERGKTRDELKNYLTTQAKTRLDQAVQAGRLTQEQANQQLQRMTTELDRMIDSTGPMMGPGGRGKGPGGPNGARPPAPGGTAPGSTSPVTPTQPVSPTGAPAQSNPA